MRFKNLVLWSALAFCSSPAFSEILVYNWNLSGEEYTSTDSQKMFLRESQAKNGYMVVEYLPDLSEFRSSSIVKYWPKGGRKLYASGNFLNGYATFQTVPMKTGTTNLLISSFSPGTLGEFYSGAILDTKAQVIGASQDMSIMHTGVGHATWRASFVGKRTVMGGGLVTLKLNKKKTSDANQSGQTVDQVVADITNDLQGLGYVNVLPIAAPDMATTAINTPVAINVLANDVDPDGGVLSVNQITTLPAHGAVVINTDKTITYTPDTDWFGSDNFTYEVINDSDGTATALVTVTTLFTGKTEVISAVKDAVGAVTTWADGDCTKASNISYNGRYVVFKTLAKNLGSSLAKVPNILIFDRILLSFQLVNAAGLTQERGNQDIATQRRIITNDINGQYVCFTTENAYTNDLNGYQDVRIWDASAPTTYHGTGYNSAGEPTNGPSGGGTISGDAMQLAFHSLATNMVTGDTNGKSDVFVLNSVANQYVRVSVSTSAVQSNGDSFNPAISVDGRFVAFESEATNLVSGGTTGWQVFLHDRDVNNTGTFDTAGNTKTILVSKNNVGSTGNGNSYLNSISDDGRYVVFASEASNLDLVVPDTNGVRDVFVFDTRTSMTTRVSLSSDKTEGNGSSDQGMISQDGSLVVFQSSANNFDLNVTNGGDNIYTHSMLTGATACSSVNSSGVPGDTPSTCPSLVSDGFQYFVTFCSAATNLYELIPGKPADNDKSQVYMQSFRK